MRLHHVSVLRLLPAALVVATTAACAPGQESESGDEAVAAAAAASTLDRLTIKGLYFPQKVDKDFHAGPIYQAALENTDGVFLQVSWRDVEQTKDHYDFSKLYEAIAAADAVTGPGPGARKRKISVAVKAGFESPKWLIGDPTNKAVPSDLTDGEKIWTRISEARRNDFCQPIIVPAPWSETFEARWKLLIAALANSTDPNDPSGPRLADRKNLTMVKLTGINYQSDESHLPTTWNRNILAEAGVHYDDDGANLNWTRAATGERGCQIDSAVAEWLRVDYRPQKIVDAFSSFLTTFAFSFPGVPLALMGGEDGFPNINDAGLTVCHAGDTACAASGKQCGAADLDCQSSASAAVYLNEPRLTPVALSALPATDGPSLFLRQANSLKDDYMDASVRQYRSAGGRTGYQAAWHVQNDPVLCTMMNQGKTSDACIAYRGYIDSGDEAAAQDFERDVMRTALSTAISDGRAHYVEMLRGDIVYEPFADLVADAKAMLGYEGTWPLAAGVAYLIPQGLTIDPQGRSNDKLALPKVKADSVAYKDKTVTLFNAGEIPLSVTAVDLQQTDTVFSVQSNTCTQPVPGGQSCAITIRFRPASPVSYGANLVVSSTDPITPVKAIPVSGTGVPPT